MPPYSTTTATTTTSANHHENFVNMNTDYDKKKNIQNKIWAKFGMLKMKGSMRNMMADQQMSRLIGEVNAGNRELTLQELQSLPEKAKKDYIKNCLNIQDQKTSQIITACRSTVTDTKHSLENAGGDIVNLSQKITDSLEKVKIAAILSRKKPRFNSNRSCRTHHNCS